MTKYIVMWIDHEQARVFHIDPDAVHETTIKAPLQSLHHKHPKGPEGAREHPDDAKRFFRDVARSLGGSVDVLVVGPSTAKSGFLRYVHEHDAALEPRIVGIETVDHPTDPQIVAYAKKYFELSRHIH